MIAVGIEIRNEIRPTSRAVAKPPKFRRFWMKSPTAPSIAVRPSQYSEIRARCPSGRIADGRNPPASLATAPDATAFTVRFLPPPGDDGFAQAYDARMARTLRIRTAVRRPPHSRPARARRRHPAGRAVVTRRPSPRAGTATG